MKTSKNLSIVLVTIFMSLWCRSGNAQGDALSYQAYLSSSLTLWERKIDQTAPASYERAMAQYGLLNTTMAGKDEKAFDKYYDPTLDLLDQLIEEKVNVASCQAVKSSVYGLAMAYDSWKGMFLGPKSSGLIEEAYESEPNNPLVVKLYASSKLYTPEMFGGDPKTALKEFERAVQLFDEAEDVPSNWLYMDALAHLGIAYGKVGQPEKAMEVYTKALALEPDFNWIKFSLKPSAEKTLASK